MNFANDVLDAIEIMVKQVVEDNVTKIYTGVCKTIGVNNCVLTINGKDNTVKYYGGVPVVGTVYQVFIPFGNMSAAFIIVPGSGRPPGSRGGFPLRQRPRQGCGSPLRQGLPAGTVNRCKKAAAHKA